MTGGQRTSLRIAAVFCGIVGLYDLLFVISTLPRGPVIGPAIEVLFPDFLVFHAAARAFFEGKLALVHDIDAFTRLQTAFYPDRLGAEVDFRPFLYPPTFLLLLLPFGLLAVVKAYGLFMTVTAAAATAVEGRRDPWGWLAVLVSPAAPYGSPPYGTPFAATDRAMRALPYWSRRCSWPRPIRSTTTCCC